ncbi:MAG: hypothetical protein GY694_20955, partial [Gammaproteobacteria bacterium]|nr:hypothetical protein [Gammaproteobacteria bacterium]
MFEIKIDNKTQKFPNRLTVDQWMKLAKWDIKEDRNWPRLIGELLNIDWRDLTEVPKGQQELLIGFLVSLMNQRRESKMFDLSQSTFGQWVDLDIWTAEGFDKSLNKALTILGPTEWADEALWKVEKWIDYRTYIYRQYAELFGLSEDEDEWEDEDQAPKSHQDIIASWYAIICGLASENLLWIDSITEQPLLAT